MEYTHILDSRAAQFVAAYSGEQQQLLEQPGQIQPFTLLYSLFTQAQDGHWETKAASALQESIGAGT